MASYDGEYGLGMITYKREHPRCGRWATVDGQEVAVLKSQTYDY